MVSKSLDPVVPISLLDTDLYKLTMQQAVLHHFPNAHATYRFTHRDKDRLIPRETVDVFKRSVQEFSKIGMTAEETAWLARKCPYFKPAYLEHLAAYRFKPEQLTITFVPEAGAADVGRLEIEAAGPWAETIMWEVPLMAALSEVYFRTADTDWSYDGQEELAREKAETFLEAGCSFTEFGTRRRRSFETQDLVVRVMSQASRTWTGEKGALTGTSNVYLAFKYDLVPSGTIAHEWFMGVAALKGYENCNGRALDYWEEVYPDALHIALTDTFSTDAFFQDFTADVERARRWKGLRQDSGDPFLYAPKAKAVYESLGIDHREKLIIFSDALKTDKVLRLKKQCDELGFPCTFGIGTFLTNDFVKASSGGGKEPSKALNMVIKLHSVGGKPTVKISDDIQKNTGDVETVQSVKALFGIPNE